MVSKFGALLAVIFLLTCGLELVIFDQYQEFQARDQVDVIDMQPIINDDVRVGKYRLQKELGFKSWSLDELNSYLVNDYIPKVDVYQYESWKLPSLFYKEGGDCEDVVLFSLAVLDHSKYSLQPVVGTYNGEGHAWLIVDDYWLIDAVYRMIPYSEMNGYQSQYYYSDMLEGSLFFGLLSRTAVWDGGGVGALASTKENWDTDTAPVAGDTIVFNSGSKACTFDIAAAFAGFYINASYSGAVTMGASFSVTGFTLASGTFTGAASYTLTCSGSFTRTAGSMTDYVLRLKMTGTGNLAIPSPYFLSFENTGTVTVTSAANWGIKSSGAGTAISFINSGTFNIVQNIVIIYWLQNAADVFTNTGTIQGAGVFAYYSSGISPTFSIGNNTMEIRIYIVTFASKTFTLSASNNLAKCPSLVRIAGISPNTMTLDLNGKNFYCGRLILDQYSIVRNSAGTKSWLKCVMGWTNVTGTGNLYSTNIYLTVGLWNPRLTNSPDTCAINDTTAYSWTPSYNETLSGSPTFAGPAWLSYAGGVISGTPDVVGVQQCWLNGTSQNGTLTLYYTWTINVTAVSGGSAFTGGALFIGSIDYDAVVLVNYSVSYTLNVTGNVTALIIPSWLTLSNNGTNTSPWVLSGQPLYVGSYAISLRSSSSLGYSYLNYTIEVSSVLSIDYNPMWIWLVFLFALTIITYVGYRRMPLLSVVGMVSVLLVAVSSVEAFGDLWMVPFVLVLVNAVISILALTRR